MKTAFFFRQLLATFSIMTSLTIDLQALTLPNPMKCFKKSDRNLQCIISNLDDSNITTFSSREMIPSDTLNLTIFCTASDGDILSAAAFHHLQKLQSLVFWNCLFLYFPYKGLINLPSLTSLTFHTSKDVGAAVVHKHIPHNSSDPHKHTFSHLLCSLQQITEIGITGYNTASINNVIPCLEPNCCGHLALLNLTANNISVISSRSFDGLENLTILDLSRNAIMAILVDVFSNLKALKRLILTLNPLEQISFQIFKFVPQLTEIVIDYDELPALPAAPDGLAALNSGEEFAYDQHDCTEYTNLKGDKKLLTSLTSFSMCIRDRNYFNTNILEMLKNVRKLSLKYTESTRQQATTALMPVFVELVLSEMVNLTHLSLDYQDLKPYPGMFSGLINLQYLSLKKITRNTKLPPFVFEGLHQLQVLKMVFSQDHPLWNSKPPSDAFMEPILDAPLRLTHLKELHISHGLLNFPMEDLANLESYVQKGLSLGKIPLTICSRKNAHRLRELNLQLNWISLIQKSMFQYCSNIELLDLSQNRLETRSIMPYNVDMNRSPFSGFLKLTHLNLRNNCIQSFDFWVIPTSLIYLDLSFNFISAVTDELGMCNVLGLQFLNLLHNQIANFDSHNFPPTMRQLFLGYYNDGGPSQHPSIQLNSESFSNLKNLEAFVLRDARSFTFTWTISPSKQGIYFDVEIWCEGTAEYEVCPMNFKILSTAVMSVTHSFNIVSFYDTVVLQHMYCQYYEDLLCAESQCDIEKQTFVNEGFTVKILNCSYAKLQEIPSMFPPSLLVDNLFLDGNNFTVIPSNCLSTFTQSIKRLYLNNSHISTIESNAFHGHGGLRELHLENNALTIIPDNMMPKSPLQFLYLQNNKIVEVQYLRSYLLRSLQALHLEDNSLTSVPSGLCGEFDVSHEIYLQNNRIASLNNIDFHLCRKLRVLSVKNNSISLINNSIPILTTVSTNKKYKDKTSTLMDLSQNKINQISGAFLRGFSVTSLTLEDNQLTRFITFELPPKQLFMLRHLNLNNNSIDTIVGSSFDSMPNLQSLFLNHNNFSELRGNEFVAIASLPHFEVLSLASNQLRSISSLTFQPLISLQILDLSGNQLSRFNASVFDKLVNLKKLFLNNNKIELLSAEFDKLHQLQYLHLNTNSLSSLNTVSFQKLQNLRELFLHNNKLISPSVWLLPKSIKMINLVNNSLTCDCDFMLEFLKWVNDLKHDKRHDLLIDHCVSNDELIKISEFDVSICNVRYEIILGASMSVLAFLFVVLCVLYYKRLEVQVWVYSRYGLRMFYKNEEEEKRYDVFISYSTVDEDFVVNELLEKLKEYRVCTYFNDFPAGALITELIAEAIESSSRTLMVFTPNFLESEWCKYEFKMAHIKSLHDRRCRLLLLIKEDVDEKKLDQEQKAYMRTNTYLRWDDPLFWEKLKFALPNTRGAIPETEHRMLIEIPVTVQEYKEDINSSD